MTPEQLSFRIDVWDAEATRIMETLAYATHLDVARAAYETALKVRPRTRVTLRQRAHVIAERLADD